MTSKEHHKKHGDLTKVISGKFGVNECAIYGTSCDDIAGFVEKVRTFFPDADIAFIDADHQSDGNTFQGTHWQDKMRSVELNVVIPDNDFQKRFALKKADLILVNGNHFSASRQIIICNKEKGNSLRKRAEELTNVVAIISTESDGSIPDFVFEILPNAKTITKVNANDTDALKNFLTSAFMQPAPLKALIMAGGRSIRMGKDKTRIVYHSEEQFLHVKHMLDRLGIASFISCRKDQSEYFVEHECEVIVDRISDMGPLGGILSAFMFDPASAWLVLACDLPLLDSEVINELIRNRNPFAVATSFVSPHDRFPEPLIAIWEPKSYQEALKFIGEGYSCPRKVLINSSAHVIKSQWPEKLANVNTIDDIEEVLGHIK